MAELPRPICLVEVELGEPPPLVPERAGDGRPYTRAAVALRVHGVIVGAVELPIATGAELAERAATELGDQIERHRREDQLADCREMHQAFLQRAPRATVIVATRDGDATLGG